MSKKVCGVRECGRRYVYEEVCVSVCEYVHEIVRVGMHVH